MIQKYTKSNVCPTYTIEEELDHRMADICGQTLLYDNKQIKDGTVTLKQVHLNEL